MLPTVLFEKSLSCRHFFIIKIRLMGPSQKLVILNSFAQRHQKHYISPFLLPFVAVNGSLVTGKILQKMS